MFPTSTLTIFIVQGAFHSTKNYGLNSDEKRMEQHFPERPKKRKTSGGISKFSEEDGSQELPRINRDRDTLCV